VSDSWKLLRAAVIVVGLCVLLAGAGALATGRAHAAPAPKVVVSLTFDDGFESVWGVLPELRHYGMHATFFINSGKLNQTGRLTTAQVQHIAADGNEIGGHSVSHPNIANLDAPEATRQICDDRVALAGILGSAPTDFAYPYGGYTPTTEAIVAKCGYNSARRVGGVASASCRPACPYAESIPPADRYAIRTGVSVVPTTAATAPEGEVNAALQHGGGWLIFVFHAYCDGCSGISVNPANLEHLLAWLKSMQAHGVQVKTVRQVVGGPARPVVAGPPPRTSVALLNPGLETRGTGRVAPDDEHSFCWEEAGYGTNSATYARVRDAHSGQWADQITMTQYSTGDAKILVRQDLGTCSVPVTPGKTLTLSAWVKSSAPTRLVVFYRQQADQWTYSAGSPSFPADASWHKVTWTTPPVPANAARVSFGVSLASVGAATVDDFGLMTRTPPDVVGESNRARLIAISGVAIVAIGLVVFWRRRAGGTR